MSDVEDLAAIGRLLRDRLAEQDAVEADPIDDTDKALIRDAVHDDADLLDILGVFLAEIDVDPSSVLVVDDDGEDVPTVIGFDTGTNRDVARYAIPRLEFAVEMANADLYVATDGTVRDRSDDPLVDRILDAADRLDPRTGRSP